MSASVRNVQHFVHGSSYPMSTDSSVWDIIFQRELRLGLRDPVRKTSHTFVGWIVPQIEDASASIFVPLHLAILRLGLNPRPIRDEDNCMRHAEQMIPFLERAAEDVDALIVCSKHIPVLAGASSKLGIPLINASFIASVIEMRQRQGYKVDPECVWRATLEIALGLLPDDDNS